MDLLSTEGAAAPSEPQGTPNAGTGGTPDIGAQEASSATQVADFLSGLPDDMKTHKSLHKFKDAQGMAKSYIELEKSLGKSPFPGEGATEEEIQAFYRKAGIPEADKYSLNVEQFGFDEALGNSLKAIAASKGIPESGLADVLATLADSSNTMEEAAVSEQKAAHMMQVKELQKEYGAAYEKYQRLGGEVAKEIFSTEELNAIQASGLNQNPMFAKVLMNMARSKFGEELISDDHTKGGFTVTPAQAEQEIKEIQANPDYRNPGPKQQLLAEKLDKLYILLENYK